MKINRAYVLLTLIPLLGMMAGCAGTVTIPASARAGDTIVLGAGWTKKFARNSLTVTITDAASNVTTYQPGNAAVRGVINLYPDPLSYLVVGARTSGHLFPSMYQAGNSFGTVINYTNTQLDPDWWETSVFLDLPPNMAVGTAQVSFASSSGGTYGPVQVQIIPGQGASETFTTTQGTLNSYMVESLERSPVSVVQFSGGSTLADSIQVDLTHDPDSSAGGTGKTFVVNPRGEMKNLSWKDNGTSLRVLLTTSGDGTSKDPYLTTYMWKYFKFYVTGGVTGVQLQNVKAYDINGDLITGVTATVTAQ